MAHLGVDAIRINPWYPSPLADGRYDVSDYRDIHPACGTLDKVALLTGALLMIVVWPLAHPTSFSRIVVAGLLGQWRLLIRYRRVWRPAMIGGHLAVTHDEKQYLPVIRRALDPL